MPSANADGVRFNGCQPSPSRAARRIAAAELPPTSSGIVRWPSGRRGDAFGNDAIPA
jgi:hypothetical protein